MWRCISHVNWQKCIHFWPLIVGGIFLQKNPTLYAIFIAFNSMKIRPTHTTSVVSVQQVTATVLFPRFVEFWNMFQNFGITNTGKILIWKLNMKFHSWLIKKNYKISIFDFDTFDIIRRHCTFWALRTITDDKKIF